MLLLSLILASCGNLSETEVAVPDPGRGILFVSDRDGNWELYIIRVNGSGLSRITNHPDVDDDPSWSPDGRWIFFRSRRDGSSDIFQMHSDGTDPENLIEDRFDSYYDEFYPQLNPDGKLLAFYSDRFPVFGDCRAGYHHLAFMDRFGGSDSITNFLLLPGEQQTMSWSPDGNQLAFSSVCNEGYPQIYLLNIKDNLVRQLTDRKFLALYPDWSPDGMSLAYVSDQSGNLDIFIIDLRSNVVRNLTNHPSKDSMPTWSPDGKKIAFTTDRDGNDEIYIMDIDGGDPINLTHHPAQDFLPSWSPIE